jgi:uncharacterized protein
MKVLMQPRKADNGGVYLSVKVQPRSSREEVAGFKNGVLRVRLTAPAVENKANEALVALLAHLLHRPKRDIRIARGHNTRQKVIFVAGGTLEQITAVLGTLP